MNLKLTAILITGMLVMGLSSNTVAQSTAGVLSDDEAATLAWMREEEKLARDTYITLYERWETRVFNNISRAEQAHMDAMLVMLNTYGIDDPISNDTVGTFNDPVLADLYGKLVADGSWIVSGHSGEGMVIDVTVDGLFVLYWMTYNKQGEQMWLLGLKA